MEASVVEATAMVLMVRYILVNVADMAVVAQLRKVASLTRRMWSRRSAVAGLREPMFKLDCYLRIALLKKTRRRVRLALSVSTFQIF